jgi:23S rRNA (cytidine1920-2'-O)/16S rRNA (cytidine1409-2'-O)-methyltransferase
MKERLDKLVWGHGLAPSREQAKMLISSGQVSVDGKIQSKPGSFWDDESVKLQVTGEVLPYVSRGGLKLEKALDAFAISLHGAVCLDIGASTGGFTDCMLQRGAQKVYCVDVGTGQLAQRLQEDSRVVSLEKTNFRYLLPQDFWKAVGEEIYPDFAGADVSFISLDKILPSAYALLKEGGSMVCLIKPQFEAGPRKTDKNGVIKDPAVQIQVIKQVIAFAEGLGFVAKNLSDSPIRGGSGNLEYLVHLQKSNETSQQDWNRQVNEVVRRAYQRKE